MNFPETSAETPLLLDLVNSRLVLGDSVYDELSDRQPVLAACYRAATAGAQLLGPRPAQPMISRTRAHRVFPVRLSLAPLR